MNVNEQRITFLTEKSVVIKIYKVRWCGKFYYSRM